MSEQILKLIYDFTKNYNDPSSKLALDENNKNLSIVIKNGNITCLVDDKDDCVHVGFAYSIPNVNKLLNKKTNH